MQRERENGWASRFAVILFCFIPLLDSQAKAQDSESYALAIVTTDEKYFPIGIAISSLVKLKLLPDHNIDLITIAADDHLQSLELLLDDQVQFALIAKSLVGDPQNGLNQDSTLRAVAALSSSDTDEGLIVTGSNQTTEDSHFLATRSDVDTDVVNKLTETVFDHLDLLRRIDENTERIILDDAPIDLPVPIHEGALRYYREREVSMPALTAFSNKNLVERYQLPEEARASVNNQTISILADKTSGGGSTIAADLAAVFDNEDGLRLMSMTSAVSLNHLGDLLYREGVDLAIIQADLLAYAEKEQIYPGLADQVRYIATLFDAEIHLLVSDDINAIEDLRDQRVSFGTDGSMAALTAANVFDELEIPIVHESLELEQAIAELKAGTLSGVMIVGTTPLPELASFQRNDGLALLPLPQDGATAPYKPATIRSEDYPGLIESGEDVRTIAVPMVLATYNWQPGGDRYAAVARFIAAFFDRLPALRDGSGHPKWREIDLKDELPGWERWHPAEAWVQRIVDNGYPLRKLIEDDRTSNDFGTAGTTPTGKEVRRYEEALLVD